MGAAEAEMIQSWDAGGQKGKPDIANEPDAWSQVKTAPQGITARYEDIRIPATLVHSLAGGEGDECGRR